MHFIGSSHTDFRNFSGLRSTKPCHHDRVADHGGVSWLLQLLLSHRWCNASRLWQTRRNFWCWTRMLTTITRNTSWSYAQTWTMLMSMRHQQLTHTPVMCLQVNIWWAVLEVLQICCRHRWHGCHLSICYGCIVANLCFKNFLHEQLALCLKPRHAKFQRFSAGNIFKIVVEQRG